MKKITAFFIILCMFALAFCGCADGTYEDNGKLKIVSVNFPGYDFAREICGDFAEITLLLPLGSESHSYEPSSRDIIKIQNCDLFIYTGGESDSWIDDILSSFETEVNTVKMMDAADKEIEEQIEGIGESAGEDEYDEHVWTSPENAEKISRAIADSLCEIDKSNADTYKANCDLYIKKLEALDKAFKDFFAAVENKQLVFGDRFPFQYFANAYGIKCYAAFPGCSSETEPSMSTVAFLTDKIKAEKISTVFYIEFSNHKIADALAEATGAETALLHSCHNVTKSDFENGVTYISLMENNLDTLKQAMK